MNYSRVGVYNKYEQKRIRGIKKSGKQIDYVVVFLGIVLIIVIIMMIVSR